MSSHQKFPSLNGVGFWNRRLAIWSKSSRWLVGRVASSAIVLRVIPLSRFEISPAPFTSLPSVVPRPPVASSDQGGRNVQKPRISNTCNSTGDPEFLGNGVLQTGQAPRSSRAAASESRGPGAARPEFRRRAAAERHFSDGLSLGRFPTCRRPADLLSRDPGAAQRAIFMQSAPLPTGSRVPL